MGPSGSRTAAGEHEWSPGRYALNYRKWIDPADSAPTTVVLSHPDTPFIRPVEEELTEDAVRAIAFEYLEKADKFLMEFVDSDGLGLPETWLGDLNPKRKPDKSGSPRSFEWLPFDPPLGKPPTAPPTRDPSQASFQIKPWKASHDAGVTLMLLASEPLNAKLFLGSEFGVCVAMQFTKDNGTKALRIIGMSGSAPFGIYSAGGLPSGRVSSAQLEAVLPYLKKARPEIAGAVQLDENTIFYRGVRIASDADGPDTLLEIRGTGEIASDADGPDTSLEIRGTGEDEPVHGTTEPLGYGFVVLARLSMEYETISISRLARVPLVTHAAASRTARVFRQDPQSSLIGTDRWRLRRPTRDEEMLDAYREEQTVCGAPACTLKNVHNDLRIEPCPRFVRADRRMASPKTVPLPGGPFPPVRSNDFSAVSAYYYGNDLFSRMRNYDIDPVTYFRVGKRPLSVYYRSGIRPGPGKDGQAVNARVTGKGWKADFFGPPKLGEFPQIELHLALGNLSHRARGRWIGTGKAQTRPERTEVEPLGIATDERWMWHEFGHVLLMAAYGELEFRFAHSPGDALAAIVADPYSRLADRKSPENRFWGSTFPWVFLPRRHDRCVTNGWSWSGTMHRAVARLPDAEKRRFKGYRSEQILSTTLFRLYRCIGGDTMRDDGGGEVPDHDVREAASHYVVYLIMRALQRCFPPPDRVEQFTDALIEADVFRDDPFEVPLDSGSNAKRIGGCTYKVVRWAFEAQGMYAADPHAINNAPGAPPPVDIYIRDHRPLTETTEGGDVTYATPGYVPVSLDWRDVPRWHATNDAIRLDDDGLHVTVENRGGETAGGVSVRVWWLAKPSNLESLEWHAGAGWNECNPPPPPREKDIPSSGTVDFGPFTGHPTAPGDYLVFAQATCADDRANSDQATGLPCSLLATPLVDLVAGDNNLGLRIIPIG